MPAEVLAPAFAAAVQRGYLVERGDELLVTDAGERQIGLLVEARRHWIVGQLSDWNADDDAHLNEAIDNLSRRLLDEEAVLEPAPA